MTPWEKGSVELVNIALQAMRTLGALFNGKCTESGGIWNQQACAVTNSTEFENKIVLSQHHCGILGFCSEQEGEFRGKVWQTRVTWWFELIRPDLIHELLLVQRH